MTDHIKQIQLATEALNTGDKQTARQILEDILMSDPNNPQLEEGWYAYSRAAENKEETIYCLQKVLSFNPNNKRAKLDLAKFQDNPLPEPTPILHTPQKVNPHTSPKFKGLSQQNMYILAGVGFLALGVFCATIFFISYDSIKSFSSSNTAPLAALPTSTVVLPGDLLQPPVKTERADCICGQVNEYLQRTGERYLSLLDDVQQVDTAIKNGRESTIDFKLLSDKALAIYKEQVADISPPCLQSFQSKSNLLFWNWQQAMEYAGDNNYEATKTFMDGFTQQVLGLEVEARKIRDALDGCPGMGTDTNPVF